MPRYRLILQVCALCALFVGSLFLAPAAPVVAAALTDVYGADANPTGEPLGGGNGYSRILLAGDYSVSTKEQLLAALVRAKAGEVIYIEPQAEIDLTGMINIAVPAGVTLAGNRGYQGSPGPLIYSNGLNTYPSLFLVLNDNVRFTGIRFRGPSGETPSTVGLNIQADNVDVDNCEVYNWSNSGVHIKDAKNVYVHHNYIHHVKQNGLGYPVCVNRATALIEANIFDYYRHAIAGSGYAGSGYEARYNLVKANAISHAFDMHGGTDFCPNQSKQCTAQEYMMAGAYVNIHHNTFEITAYNSIILRGVPTQFVEVHHNTFLAAYPDMAFRFQNYAGGNAHVYQNLYGPDKRLVETHIEPSPFIYKTDSSDVYALADGQLLKYGFLNLSGKSVQTVQGELRVDLQPVQITPYAGQPADVKPFVISNVELRLSNGTVIYSAAQMPAAGEVVVDTRKLANGVYRLSLKIGNNLGRALEQSVTFRVAN